MPSPFPGMDPYLETPRRWLAFHNALADEIQAALNQTLDPRYAAWLTSSTSYETVEVARARTIQPDVSVWKVPSPREGSSGGVATIARPTIIAAPVKSAVPMEAAVDLYRVEVRTVAEDQLVTLIEILSRSNKRPGHRDTAKYYRKRQDLLWSSVHLLEIDLLRDGERPPLMQPVPDSPYRVVLSRAKQRPIADVWPIQLADALPVLPIPLLEPDPDAPLDLGAAAALVYERGPYGRTIDYREPPPPPPLSDAESAWVEQRLREYRATDGTTGGSP